MDKDKREMVCIGCPNGCRMTVWMDEQNQLQVTGQVCNRGTVYAQGEFSDPRRMVTGSVWVTGGEMPLVSVKTSQPVPKARIDAVLREIAGLTLNAPVTIGQTLIEQVAGTDADIISTRTVNVL